MTITVLSLYIISGCVLFAAYETWSPETKVVYFFCFPLHWITVHWVVAMWKNGTVLDSWPLLIPFWIALCLFLLAGLL